MKATPRAETPSVTISIDDPDSQVPFSAYPFYPDPIYPMDHNRISKPRWVTPMVTVSAIDPQFPDSTKSFNMIFLY
jgi:hypothetical protein